MSNDGERSETKDTPEMEANARLREHYLRLMSSFGDKEVHLRMYGKMKLTGKFVALQQNNEHIFVDDLMTPTGVVKRAALRTKDITSITTAAKYLK